MKTRLSIFHLILLEVSLGTLNNNSNVLLSNKVPFKVIATSAVAFSASFSKNNLFSDGASSRTYNFPKLSIFIYGLSNGVVLSISMNFRFVIPVSLNKSLGKELLSIS